MANKPKVIAITGAESTGKSTLTKALSEHFNIPLSSEYARDYIEKLGRSYTYNDVEKIAKEQVKQLDTLLKENHSIIVLDTWLLITKVWFEVAFGKVPHWFEKKICQTPIDLFLVCDTDIPWIADRVRENGGENRELLHNRYMEEIKKAGFRYELINGDEAERTRKAIQFISKL